MKFKYYLRGIGIGIIFASIIFLIAYRENVPSRMSDEEIINRAKQLGMVEANDPINKLIDKKTDEKEVAQNNETSSEVVTEEVTTKEDKTTEEVTTKEQTTEETTTEEKTTEKETTEEKTTEEKTTEEKTTEKETTEKKTTEEKTTEEKTTEQKNTEKKSTKKETVEITISRGSSSYPVCQKLEELGLIDDAAKYDDYLIEHGYANRISVGTHKLTKGMTYKQIAELISDPIED